MTTAIFSAACTAARLAMADLPVAYAAAVPVEDLTLLYDRLVADIRRTLQDPTLPADPKAERDARPLTPWQRAAVIAFDQDVAWCENIAAVRDMGDHFAAMLLIELDPSEDCKDGAEAARRARNLADQFQAVADALDAAENPTPVNVADIGPGDRVDLQNAPGCDGESFISAEFEYARCIGSERETADCIRLDFEGFPSVGFDPSVSLPTIKATPEEAETWKES